MITAGLAVAFNIVLGLTLGHHGSAHTHHGHSHSDTSSQQVNIHAAVIHVLGDLIQSLGVFVSAILIKFFPSCKWLDPVCTALFAVIVFGTTMPIARDLILVLMESIPKDIDYDRVVSSLEGLEGVAKVDKLKIWSLTTSKKACVSHLRLKDANSMADVNHLVNQASVLMADNYGIEDTTIQINI